jgi:hypothetical protein
MLSRYPSDLISGEAPDDDTVTAPGDIGGTDPENSDGDSDSSDGTDSSTTGEDTSETSLTLLRVCDWDQYDR